MAYQLMVLGLILLIAPYFPRFFTPLSVSMGSLLLVQKANPRVLSSVFVGGSTLAVIIVRVIEGYLIEKFVAYQKRKKYTDVFSIEWEKIKKYFHEHKSSKRRGKLIQKLESEEGQYILFGLAILGFIPTIPDFLTVALLHKKLRLVYLILAAVIGKTVQFVPIIFLGKGIVAYFKL